MLPMMWKLIMASSQIQRYCQAPISATEVARITSSSDLSIQRLARRLLRIALNFDNLVIEILTE